MEGTISHTGRIIAVDSDFISVEIVSESACGTCHARSFCGLDDSKSKVIQIPVCRGSWAPGDEVVVNLRKTMGYKAVWIAYVIPLIVLMGSLLIPLRAGMSEPASALVAFAAVALYYLAVFLFRNRLENEYSFYITK